MFSASAGGWGCPDNILELNVYISDLQQALQLYGQQTDCWAKAAFQHNHLKIEKFGNAKGEKKKI